MSLFEEDEGSAQGRRTHLLSHRTDALSSARPLITDAAGIPLTARSRSLTTFDIPARLSPAGLRAAATHNPPVCRAATRRQMENFGWRGASRAVLRAGRLTEHY